MGIQLTALLHCHQPDRDLYNTAYIPLKQRYSGKIQNRALIPNLYAEAEKRYEDYNKKITKECYEPCAEKDIYSRLPFNMSPSLLKDLWIRDRAVYNKIIENEKRSFDRFGHSNAIAQASPNHVIMPLATDKDKLLYVLWSIEEYEKHYGRFPEGMWLPEAAVDKKTLKTLAELGVKYVVLAPRQAKKVKPLLSDENSWQNVENGTVDISKPYKIYFEDTKKEIAVFFYEKGFSGSIGFPDDHNKWIYHNSENFVARWLNIWGRLKHFAVDGETFGHHPTGANPDLLAGALNLIENNPNIGLTNYGLYLAENPPMWDVEIVDNSSWSCEHGLVRWGREFTNEADNCHEGTLGSEWRVEMRRAFDRLAIDLDQIFLRHADKYFKDPRKALENYGSVVSGKKTFYDFFEDYGKKGLADNEIEEAYKLMEMQRFKLNMFTSCGWFHDYVKRPEPFGNFLFAYSAIQIAKHFEKKSKLEERFLQHPEQEKLSQTPAKYYEQAKIDMISVYNAAKNTMNQYQKEIGNSILIAA